MHNETRSRSEAMAAGLAAGLPAALIERHLELADGLDAIEASQRAHFGERYARPASHGAINLHGTFVPVSDLSAAVRGVLKSVEYGARDIELVPTQAVSLNAMATCEGRRGFVVGLNLETGERLARDGDWGGANAFGSSAVDLTRDVLDLPPNAVVVKGERGYPRTFAKVYCHPSVLAGMLPPAREELTQEEQQAIYCFCAIKGGEYRREELRRRRVQPSTVASLVERGYLAQNRAGAVQVTTKGKNARDRRVAF